MEKKMNIKKNERYENGLLKFQNGWYHYNTKEGEMYQISKGTNEKKWSVSKYYDGDGFNWTVIGNSYTLKSSLSMIDSWVELTS